MTGYPPAAQADENQRRVIGAGRLSTTGAVPPWHVLTRAVAAVEYWAVSMAGALLGISTVVRYLRNPNPRVTAKILRAFGATIGSRTTLKGSIFVDNSYGDQNSTDDFSHLIIGDNCYIGEAVFFDLADQIIIENDAVIAGRASFITHAECRRSGYLSQKFPRSCGAVTVGGGAWIGFGATILCGVTVGSNSAVGAHSLVLQDTEPRCVYVGNPAKKLRGLDE
jgi:acetyltransferase-like isoleucine patch superfamily enzyme